MFSVAQITADAKELLPGFTDEFGPVVEVKVPNGYTIKVICKYLEIKVDKTDSPELMGSSSNKPPPHQWSAAHVRWLTDATTVYFHYFAQKMIKWPSTPAPEQKGKKGKVTVLPHPDALPPTTVWPKELVHKLFERALILQEYDQARRFLQMGANPKAFIRTSQRTWYTGNEKIPDYAEGGNSMHWACEEAFVDTVKFLKEVGAWDVKSVDEGGRTPLHYLMSGIHPCVRGTDARIAIMELLLADPDCNVNALTKKGNTPLIALLYGRHSQGEMIQLLETFLKLGKPDTSIKSVEHGIDAMKLVTRREQPDLAELLENYNKSK